MDQREGEDIEETFIGIDVFYRKGLIIGNKIRAEIIHTHHSHIILDLRDFKLESRTLDLAGGPHDRASSVQGSSDLRGNAIKPVDPDMKPVEAVFIPDIQDRPQYAGHPDRQAEDLDQRIKPVLPQPPDDQSER